MSHWAELPSEQFGLMVSLIFSLTKSLFKMLYPLLGTRFYVEHRTVRWGIDTGIAHIRLLKDLDSSKRLLHPPRPNERGGDYNLKNTNLLTVTPT